MKFAALVILLLFLAGPLLLGAWLVFPLIAGLALWLIVGRYSDTQTVKRFGRPIALIILLGFLVWLFFIPRRPAVRAYDQGFTAGLLQRIAGSPPGAPSPDQDAARVERQRFLDAIARARSKLAGVSAALETYNSADAVFVRRNGHGLPDTAGLGPALGSLRNVLSPHTLQDGSASLDLLDARNVKTTIQSAGEVLRKTEQQVTGTPTLSAEQILARRNQIPFLMRPFQIDSVYDEVAKVELALRQTLRADTNISQGFSVAYDRLADSLTSEHRVAIGLVNQRAVGVDLHGFFPAPGENLTATASLREDAGQERPIQADALVVPLRPETKQIVLTRQMHQAKASYPLLTDRFWIPFRGVTVRWPLPLVSSVVVSMQFPDDPSMTWPLTVTIPNDGTPALESIRVPRNSFYYADTDLKPANTTDLDELVPQPSTPKVAELATDKSIRLQLLPWYLSNSTGQKFKEYFVVENLFAALIVAIATATLAALFTQK